jgi:hypothetical protein
MSYQLAIGETLLSFVEQVAELPKQALKVTAHNALKGAQEFHNWRMDANEKRQVDLLAKVVRGRDENRKFSDAIANIDQLTRPTAPTQATTSSTGASIRASAMNLSQSPSREFGFRTRDLELAFVNKDLNKGNWPVMTPSPSAIGPRARRGRAEGPRTEGRRTRGG